MFCFGVPEETHSFRSSLLVGPTLAPKVVNVGLEDEIKSSFMQYAMSIILVRRRALRYAAVLLTPNRRFI